MVVGTSVQVPLVLGCIGADQQVHPPLRGWRRDGVESWDVEASLYHIVRRVERVTKVAGEGVNRSGDVMRDCRVEKVLV